MDAHDSHPPALTRMIDQIAQAHYDAAPLCIQGGRTKDFYGREPVGQPLDTTALAGIVSHEPSELVITARCGTPLQELEDVLARHHQCLAFEPPHYGSGGTVGGMVAAGLSGPARASRGAVRDHVLGATLLNAKGQVLRFGGQVIKNVAGYDVSRLLCGSLGTLGVILDVSLRVVPVTAADITLRFEMDAATAIEQVNRWIGAALPVDASAWHDGLLHLRLRGAAAAVRAGNQTLSGIALDPEPASAYWRDLRDHRNSFFAGDDPLWRISVPATSPALPLPATTAQLIEWHGAQRWVRTKLPAEDMFGMAWQVGGHATLFRGGPRDQVFAPLEITVARIHQTLKHNFDPAGVFNPARLYPHT